MNAPVRLNLADTVADLMPLEPPPCFHSRMAWREYLITSAEGQNVARKSSCVILRDEAGEPRFNHDYQFCKDCSAQHSLAMTAAGRCDPDHLKKLGEKLNKKDTI